jgi:hypothetical protein
MTSIRDLLKPFAESIFAKASAVSGLTLSEKQLKRFRESISDDIRKCSNFHKRELSRAAQEQAQVIAVDLLTQDWHDQPRFDPKRRVLQFEHIVPVLTIRKKCLSARTVEEVLSILEVEIRVAWILKEEDRRLTSLGFKSKRPDPDHAYRLARIELVGNA